MCSSHRGKQCTRSEEEAEEKEGGENKWKRSGRDELEGCKHRQKEKERSEWLVKGSKWEEYMSRRECENFGRDK